MAENPTGRRSEGRREEPQCGVNQKKAKCLKLPGCTLCGGHSLAPWETGSTTCLPYMDLCVDLFYLPPQFGSTSGGDNKTDAR